MHIVKREKEEEITILVSKRGGVAVRKPEYYIVTVYAFEELISVIANREMQR